MERDSDNYIKRKSLEDLQEKDESKPASAFDDSGNGEVLKRCLLQIKVKGGTRGMKP